MLLSTALNVLALASSVIGDRSRCGPRDPHERLMQQHAAHEDENRQPHSAKFGNDRSYASSTSTSGSTNVNTYVHVVASLAEASDFNQQMVDDQISVMNIAYAPTGFQFILLKTTFTTNDDWAAATDGSQEEYDMKSSLRKGDYGDLNIYFVSNLGGGLLGVCPFPDEHSGSDDTFLLDGCMVQASSMPGGDETNYDLGGTAVHEVGHWFGLLHVFQGVSCAPGGDHILDTPRQSTSTNGCPTSKDSCPGIEGLDSIHNFMDYSYDSCYEDFTPDQKLRMVRLFDTYRASYTST